MAAAQKVSSARKTLGVIKPHEVCLQLIGKGKAVPTPEDIPAIEVDVGVNLY
jgi:hypothetical protein